jgi:hypothetical protein
MERDKRVLIALVENAQELLGRIAENFFEEGEGPWEDAQAYIKQAKRITEQVRRKEMGNGH